MMLILKSSVRLIVLSMLFYSCQKEYSLEGNVVGGGTAVFTFTGAPGACTNSVVTGIYQVGVALGSTNVVTISVDVTTIGNYTIATGTLNGISFSKTGSFTTTGPQTISLTGTGIPTAAGIISFTPGTSGCSFPVTIAGGGGGSGGTAVFTLAGAPGNCSSFTPGGTYTAGVALGAGNFATVSVNVTTVGTYTISTGSVNGISFAAAGTFTATGTQTVQLSGTGTPLAAGSFNYTPGTNGCTFAITVTGTVSTAVYTFTGAPGVCTSAAIGGTYTTGTALAATNTVTVGVTVTTIGTYTITTPAANGFSFAGTGSFTATGAQTVILTGTGTPVAAGIFNFSLPNNGCTFQVTVVAGTVATDFIRCTIDGVARTFNMDLVGEYLSSSTDTFAIEGYETSAATSPGFLITIRKAPQVTTGTYNKYSATNTVTFGAGGYYDGVSSSLWVSGVLLQPLPFTVIVSSLTTNPNRITGTFTGTLYDNFGQGNTAKPVTLGSFSLPY